MHKTERKSPPMPPNTAEMLCLTMVTSFSQFKTGKCRLTAMPYTQENRMMTAGIRIRKMQSEKEPGFRAGISRASDIK